MKATLTNYGQSPRKVRLVADLIRGKSVREARTILSFFPKKSSPMFLTLLGSALSNATGASDTDLVVKAVTVDKGVVLRRFKPMARGRAAAFRRTRSIISIVLEKRQEKKEKKSASSKKK